MLATATSTAQIAASRTARRPARRSRGREASGGAVLNTAKVEAGDNCIVFGLGGIGLNVIQGLRLAGADMSSGSTSTKTARRGASASA
jgi:Zn-dependent alcohol dehydrogenase